MLDWGENVTVKLYFAPFCNNSKRKHHDPRFTQKRFIRTGTPSAF